MPSSGLQADIQAKHCTHNKLIFEKEELFISTLIWTREEVGKVNRGANWMSLFKKIDKESCNYQVTDASNE